MIFVQTDQNKLDFQVLLAQKNYPKGVKTKQISVCNRRESLRHACVNFGYLELNIRKGAFNDMKKFRTKTGSVSKFFLQEKHQKLSYHTQSLLSDKKAPIKKPKVRPVWSLTWRKRDLQLNDFYHSDQMCLHLQDLIGNDTFEKLFDSTEF